MQTDELILYHAPDRLMKELAPYVLSHRIIIKGEYEIDGFKSADLVKKIIDTVYKQ